MITEELQLLKVMITKKKFPLCIFLPKRSSNGRDFDETRYMFFL